MKFLASFRIPSKVVKGFPHRIRFYVYIIVVTLPLVVIANFLYLLVYPCTPINLGSIFLDECYTSKQHRNAVELAIILFFSTLSCWIGVFTFASTCLECVVFGGIPCISIISCIEVCKKRFSVTRKITELPSAANLWRQLQLLVRMYNFIHQSVLAPCSSLLVSFVFIISVYAVFGLKNQLHVTQLALFSALAFDTLLLSLDVGDTLKSSVHSFSKKCLNDIKITPLFSLKSKLPARYIKSFSPLKVYCGSSNYYDQQMPVDLVNFNLSQTASLLLI